MDSIQEDGRRLPRGETDLILNTSQGGMVPTLQLLPAGSPSDLHHGEVSACCYAANGQYVLSGGWDGHLRMWDARTFTPVTAFRVGHKPVSACAIAPRWDQWLAGNLDGLLSRWDPETHRQVSTFLAHPRPISAIVFRDDGPMMATASWDSTLILWTGREREGYTLRGHTDIVAGCRFTPDGQVLLSWSYDGQGLLWDVTRGSLWKTLKGHDDRVLSAAVSPDGSMAVSGARDGSLKVWDVKAEAAVGSLILGKEIRSCFFLPHGGSIGTVEANGRVRLYR